MRTCNSTTKLGKDEFCEFKVSSLGSKCTKDMKFGYEAGKPCIIVKLNKIFNWKPKVYNTTDDLPEKMPKDVRDLIERDFTEEDSNIVSDRDIRVCVCVSVHCAIAWLLAGVLHCVS